MFTSNTTEGLELRFLSRTRQIEFSSYGLASEGARLLESIWQRETRGAAAPNFADAVVVWKFDRFARSVSHLLRALETFNALGVAFVSFSEQIDTSTPTPTPTPTPTGKMVFTVLGAVAKLERSLIAERVRAGLRNARAKGKRLGRPPKNLDAKRIATLRAQGVGWRAIAKQPGVGVGTLYRAVPGCSKIRERVFGTR